MTFHGGEMVDPSAKQFLLCEFGKKKKVHCEILQICDSDSILANNLFHYIISKFLMYNYF